MFFTSILNKYSMFLFDNRKCDVFSSNKKCFTTITERNHLGKMTFLVSTIDHVKRVIHT